MHRHQRIAVIGLGRFGVALARRLSAHDAEVIAIDNDAAMINEIKDDVASAVCLDSTDESALRSQEVEQVDICVVSIGENFEAALLTTVICKNNLAIPHVICRAQTTFHAQIFRQIGADEVVQPEQNAGDMLGRRLAHPQVSDYIKLGDGFTVAEMLPPPSFVGKTVLEINLRSLHQVNLIAIRRQTAAKDTTADSEGGTADGSKRRDRAHEAADDEGKPTTRLIAVPGPSDRIAETDLLVLSGSEEAITRLADL